MRLGALALIIVLTLGSPVQAEGLTPEQYRRAFVDAATCYVVLSNASHERTKQGDTVRAAYYKQKADKALEEAFIANRLGGRSEREFSAEVERITNAELPKVARDAAYNLKAGGRCKAIGYF